MSGRVHPKQDVTNPRADERSREPSTLSNHQWQRISQPYRLPDLLHNHPREYGHTKDPEAPPDQCQHQVEIGSDPRRARPALDRPPEYQKRAELQYHHAYEEFLHFEDRRRSRQSGGVIGEE